MADDHIWEGEELKFWASSVYRLLGHSFVAFEAEYLHFTREVNIDTGVHALHKSRFSVCKLPVGLPLKMLTLVQAKEEVTEATVVLKTHIIPQFCVNICLKD